MSGTELGSSMTHFIGFTIFVHFTVFEVLQAKGLCVCVVGSEHGFISVSAAAGKGWSSSYARNRVFIPLILA